MREKSAGIGNGRKKSQSFGPFIVVMSQRYITCIAVYLWHIIGNPCLPVWYQGHTYIIFAMFFFLNSLSIFKLHL